MRGLPVVYDDKIKSGCITVDIQQDGQVRAFKHSAHHLIPYFHGYRKECLRFIQCQDVQKTYDLLVGAASMSHFCNKAKNEWIHDIFLVLVRGIYFCHASNKLMVVFHRWKAQGCESFIGKLFDRYKHDNTGFIQQTFMAKHEVISHQKNHICWLNQITGPHLHSIQNIFCTFVK